MNTIGLWYILTLRLLSANFNCISRTSSVSGKRDDDTTFAKCDSAPYTTLVSCGCKPQKASDSQTDGCYIIGDRCYAQNGAHGKGMYAIARCCDFNHIPDLECIADDIPQYATGNGGMKAMQCNSVSSTHPFLTGCSVHSHWSLFDGCYPGTMNPHSHPPLVDIDYPFTHLNAYCTAVNGASEGTHGSKASGRSQATCGPDYEMTSCSGYGAYLSVNSWYISNDKCVATSHNTKPVYAIAICCKLETNSPTTDPTTTPTAAPTANPSSRPTRAPTQTPSVSPTTEPTMEPIAVTRAAGRMMQSDSFYFQTWFWVFIVLVVGVCGILIWIFVCKRKKDASHFVEMNAEEDATELHQVLKRNAVNYT